jgi:hypothetical protein
MFSTCNKNWHENPYLRKQEQGYGEIGRRNGEGAGKKGMGRL